MGLQPWPLQIIRHSSSSTYPTLRSQLRTTSKPPAASLSRTLLFPELWHNFKLLKFLDVVKEGALEKIEWLKVPGKKQDTLSLTFFHHLSASRLHRRLKLELPLFQVFMAPPQPVSVETVASVGAVGANRSVHIHGLETNNIPRGQFLSHMRRYGTFEKVRVLKRDILSIHYMEMKQALRAVTQLRETSEYRDLHVVFSAHERCEPIHVYPRSILYNTVKLRGMPFNTNAYTILSKMQTPPLKSLDTYKGVVYINFYDHKSASNFLSSESWKVHGEKVSAVPNGELVVPRRIARAREIGASRTVVLTGDMSGVTTEILRANFGEFNRLYSVHVYPEEKSAFLLFQDIEFALNAVYRISSIRDFEDLIIQRGMEISFAPDPDIIPVLPPLGGLQPFKPTAKKVSGSDSS